MENDTKSSGDRFLDIVRPIQDALTPEQREECFTGAVSIAGVPVVVLPKEKDI